MSDRESATQTFKCGRRIRVLADEYGDHRCECAVCREVADEPPDVTPQRAENKSIEDEINAAIRDFPGVMAFSGEASVELCCEWAITTDKPNNRRHVLEELRDRAQHLADDLQALLDGRTER